METVVEVEQMLKNMGIFNATVGSGMNEGEYTVIAQDDRGSAYEIGDYKNLYAMCQGIERDALKTTADYPQIVTEDKRLTTFESIVRLAVINASKWQRGDDHYWLARLMQEVGEAASVVAGDHDDSLRWELMQIASIAMNWLVRLDRIDGALEDVNEEHRRAYCADQWAR